VNALQIALIIVVILLVGSILLQSGESGMFSAGGMMTGGEHYHTRRGVERIMFYATIGLTIIFVVLSLLLVR
jgi:preprotein translocase subunit SecG